MYCQHECIHCQQARERARIARWVAGREVIQEQIAERQLHRMVEEEAQVQEGQAIKQVHTMGVKFA